MCVCKSVWRHINLFFGHTLLHKVPVLFLCTSLAHNISLSSYLSVLHIKGAAIWKVSGWENFAFRQGKKKRQRKWEGEGSQTCAPLHLIVSAEALSASLCPSASSYILCFISYSVSLASLPPPFSVSLALYLSLPVSCCVSVTGEDARLLLSPLKMTPLMLAGTLTVVAGSETLRVCWTARKL